MMGTFGPALGVTAANDSGVGSVAWSSTINALLSDDNAATAVLLITQQSQYLVVSNFQFAIPLDAAVVGIQVDIERKGSVLSGTQDASVRLFKAGVAVGDDLAAGGSWPSSDAVATYGGASSLWGTTWTPADINASGFGVAISATALLGVTVSVDQITVTVTYQGSNRGVVRVRSQPVGANGISQSG